jgi:hypothetical protein
VVDVEYIVMELRRLRAWIAWLSIVTACGGEPPSDASIDAWFDNGSDVAIVDVHLTTPDATLDDRARMLDVTADSATPADATAPSDVATLRCALPAPFDEHAVYARTLYVSTAGNDTTGDGSEARPFATLRAAGMRATPGTRVLLRAGTYTGTAFLSNLQGSAAMPIAIVGEGEVILDAGRMGEVLHLSDPRYVVLENLTLQNATLNGLNIDDGGTAATPAEFVVLRRLRLRMIGSGGNNDCIKLSGVDRFHVLDSDISSCNAGDAIDMVGCHDGVIAHNHIHDTVGSGGIQAKGGSARVTIHGNRFVAVNGRSINAGGSTGLEFFRPIDAPHEAAQLRVTSNLFIRPGANSGATIAYVGCDACVFANNTVIEPRTWVARILQETTGTRFVPSRNGLFVNNLVVFNQADIRAFINVGANTAPSTFVFGNNLWFALDRPSFSGPAVSDGIPPETGTLFQRDPMFVDRSSGDYRITDSSPAARAGRAVEGPAFSAFDGSCHGVPPSIGAFAPR